jgi:hypothetical protein
MKLCARNDCVVAAVVLTAGMTALPTATEELATGAFETRGAGVTSHQKLKR